MPTTSRLSIPYPAGSDPVDVNGDLQSVAEALDDAALADQGLLSARPAAGTMGRLYRATDNGKVYWDTGSTWVACSAATATADLDDSAVTTGKIADAAVTSAKLKPTVLSAAASAGLTLTTSEADITGATVTFTPDAASTIIATAIFDFELLPNTFVLGEDVYALGYINVAGDNGPQAARFRLRQNVAGSVGTLETRGTVAVQRIVNVTASSTTIKLRAKLNSSISGTAYAAITTTTLAALVVSQ